MSALNHQDYYRLPWNLPDNSISWLEPTVQCNLACYGCYRRNEAGGHKSLEQIEDDLDVFQKFRKFDAVSIAGGDPLVHPEIIEIVRRVKARDLKPILNTNGLALTPELLRELKQAGATGFTFHIDSKQNRPGWKDANELELNELRHTYAQMVADAGDLACAFNSTVYEDSKKFVPEMMKWAERNIDIVQLMVFILYRAIDAGRFDFFAGSEKLQADGLIYNDEGEDKKDVKTQEIYDLIRSEYPDFDGCAFLNGTDRPDSIKWLLSGRLGVPGKTYGYMGKKGMEIIQMFHHLIRDRYLAYSGPRTTRMGKSMLLFGVLDHRLRSAAKRFYSNPLNLFRRLHYQSIMVIQPIDLLDDGSQIMCDSCPDLSVWNGQLVWSCRMDEQLNYGCNLTTRPKAPCGAQKIASEEIPTGAA
ncbi:MAG: radical SAM protein [Myxococcota bacterium]